MTDLNGTRLFLVVRTTPSCVLGVVSDWNSGQPTLHMPIFAAGACCLLTPREACTTVVPGIVYRHRGSESAHDRGQLHTQILYSVRTMSSRYSARRASEKAALAVEVSPSEQGSCDFAVAARRGRYSRVLWQENENSVRLRVPVSGIARVLSATLFFAS